MNEGSSDGEGLVIRPQVARAALAAGAADVAAPAARGTQLQAWAILATRLHAMANFASLTDVSRYLVLCLRLFL